jgi:cubilin
LQCLKWNFFHSLAPLLGKFCGEKVPAPFKSMGNTLYFRFYSDSSRNGAGFELEWDGTSAGCGGILSSAKGAIISPNYPLNYPHNAQCEWRITVNEGSSIHIVFSDLDLEVNSECRYDYVQIYDGPDASARSIGQYCEEHPMHIETTSNHAMIRMNTDESHSGRGFHIKYSANCNRTIEADTGIIESPNFPEDYPNNLDCAWTIKVSRGNRVNMQFSHFEIENDNIFHNGTKDHDCKYDFVTIYDYDYESNDKKSQKSYCNKAPEIRTSSTDSVVVVFHTDQATVGTGFRLEWYNEGCGGRLTHPEGGFTSPNYPKRYDHGHICTWEITVEYGYNVKLTIHDFDIERSSSCQFDSLTIAHDKTFNTSLVAKVCQTLTQPMIITSDGHQLFVRFTADESHSGKGFNITYESVVSDCGGVFTVPNGIIKTPSYPTKNYDNNRTCEWLIRTDDTHSIEFQLTDFDLEETLNCTKDYLEIVDPIFNTTLWRGCGSEVPSETVFRSKRNEMIIRLTTDDTITAKGFIGNFTISCGGRFVVDDGWGELAYRKASENLDCSWSIIAADPSKHVTLTFTYSEVFYESDLGCLLSIQVFEGDVDALGALRKSFCSSKTPPAIISHGNALTVRYNSSGLGSTSELDMHYSVMDNG